MVVNPETDIVVTPEALSTAGAVSYWRAGGTVSIAALSKAWEAAGLDTALLRKEPEPETALRRAVLDLADRVSIVINSKDAERRTLVRPCQEVSTWAIVEEIVEEGAAPTYTTLAIVSFVNGNPHVEQIGGSNEQTTDIEARVLAGFTAHHGLYDPSDITGWLVKLAYKHKAVTLRDSGGVYFIPRASMDFWNKAADALEAASGKAHKVFRIPAMKNAEAIEAIVDAVTAEAEQVAQQIDDQVNAGLGARALETRKASVNALLEKIASYEELVGQQLKVRERVESLGAAVAAAALASMVSDGEGAAA
jgi:hypothetical protein